MRQILCIILVACGIIMSAQAQSRVAFSEDVVFRNGKLYVGDVRLTAANAADYLSASQAKRYVNAYRTETVGAILGCVGAGLATASGVYWGVSAAQFRASSPGTIGTDIMPAGLTLGPFGVVIGSVVGLSGMVTWLSGRGRLRLLEESIRMAGLSQAGLSVGVTPNGVGLALNF